MSKTKMAKRDCETMNLVNGEVKESKNNYDKFMSFIERWGKKIEDKNLLLNDQQAYDLVNEFLTEWEPFMYEGELLNKSIILIQLYHDLHLAIIKANNNYKKQFPSFLDKFHKLKLPDLNLIKK